MKRTGVGTLAAVAALGTAVGFGVDQLLTDAGRATFTPSWLLAVLLVLLAASVLLFARQIRRATLGAAVPRVDPFRAVRIAMLAKASSIVGAAVAGVALGLLLFLLTRPVTPVGSVGPVIAALAGGVLLLAAALVAEHWCTIRKDDDDEHPGPPDPGDPGFGLSHHY